MGRSRSNALRKKSDDEGEDFILPWDIGPGLDDQLREKGIFYLVGGISDNSCLSLHHALLLYTQEKPPRNGISIVINSTGGSLSTAWALIDLMTLMKPWMTIKTIAIGEASSAASLILAAGSKGHRYIGQNCSITLHDAMLLLPDGAHRAADIMAISKDLELEHERLMRFWGESTGTTDPKEIQEIFLSQVDSPVNAAKAIELGLADHVMSCIAEPLNPTKKRTTKEKPKND